MTVDSDSQEFHSETVLLVDTSPAQRRNVSYLIRKHGVRVETLCDGIGATKWLDTEAHAPDVIVLDLAILGVSAFDLVARVRAQWPASDVRVIVLADDPSYDQSLAKRSAALRFAEVLWLPVAPEHLAARVFAHLRAQQEDAVTGTPTPPPRGELSSGSSSNSSRFGAPTPPRSSGESARSWSSNDSTGESTQPAPVRPVRYGSCPSLLGTVVVENRYAESGQSRERTAARARNVAMALRREFEKVCSSPLAANRIQTAFPEQDAESSGGPPAAGRMVAPQNPGGSGGGKGGGGMLPRGPAGVAANDAAGPLPRLSWRRLSIGGQIVGAVALAATAGATATALFYEYTAPCA